jgi:AP-3 complex subunit delta-1
MDVAMKKVGSKMKTGIDRIFDKTLQDLVRGVRNAKGHEREYVLEAVEEIREELKNPKSDVKSVAISKLCFLHMLGYEMGWASFNIIEVMSSTKERFFENYDILPNILFNNLYNNLYL